MENKNFYAKPLASKLDYIALAEKRYENHYGAKHILLGLIMPVIGMCLVFWPIVKVYPETIFEKVIVAIFVTVLLLSTFTIVRLRNKAINSLLKSWGKDK